MIKLIEAAHNKRNYSSYTELVNDLNVIFHKGFTFFCLRPVPLSSLPKCFRNEFHSIKDAMPPLETNKPLFQIKK